MANLLPALKLQPHTLPLGQLLEAVDNHTGNYKQIEEAVYRVWLGSTRRTRAPNKRNALRAVIGPSLRHLGLARGEGNDFRLTGAGKRLLEAYQTSGEPRMKKELAAHLVRVDKDYWVDLLGRLRQAGGRLPLMSILDQLRGELVNSEVDQDKLRKYLKFFEYADLVSFQDGDIRLHQKQADAAQAYSFRTLSEQEFVQALKEAYTRRVDRTRSPFVAIPVLRDEVCERTGLFSDDFDLLLMRVPRETEEYILQFSQPMVRRPGGLHVGNIYLYYLAIYPGRR